MDDRDRLLTEILIDHDLDLVERRAQRTELSWPDESDIFASTRQRLRDLFECDRYEQRPVWQ